LINYRVEPLESFLSEAIPLFHANNKEINLFDKDLDLDFQTYLELDKAGILKCFTVRSNTKLVGYALFSKVNNAQHKDMVVAHQDVIYIMPEYRLSGIKLLRYTEKVFKEEGVDYIFQAAPKISRFGKVLERLGYTELETIYTRKLSNGWQQSDQKSSS